jgi:polysaccharide pyruvyl transferase WcaK-like protein
MTMGWADSLGRWLDPDRALQATMDALIEMAGTRYALDRSPSVYRPDAPLKLLFAGYTGTRNTGADVRVEEMIRQVRHVLGDDNLELTIMTVDEQLSAGYFRTVRQVELPTIFPKFLFDECPKHHGVVACEGSMFKSKFASALTTMMAGALGMAAAEKKLSVGYGAEAGEMAPSLRRFVEKNCKSSLVLCRNEPSRAVLSQLGIRNGGGADTAWTFEPAPLSRGAQLLKAQGWDGHTPVLAVGPINPFWWPVRPDLVKAAAMQLSGQFKREHYKSVYFHNASADVEQKFAGYCDALASAVNAFCRDRQVFVVLVGMEMLDRLACEQVNARLSKRAPLFISDEHTMYDLVSVLRNCSTLVTSRFHAIVTSMPGLVVSGGITMDERIRNLLADRGHQHLCLEVDDPQLEHKTLDLLRRLERDADAIREGIARAIPRQLRLMGQMGLDFADEVARVYPDFPRPDLARTWDAHLPRLPAALGPIMEKYA